MSKIEQLTRIALYLGGAYFFGDATASGELYQGAIGGTIAIGAFAWWVKQNWA